MKSIVLLLSITIIFSSCGGSSSNSSNDNNADYNRDEANEVYDENDDESFERAFEEDINNESSDKNGFEDGIYKAEVDYYNPETDYSTTYTLDVKIESNEVTVIYFSNDGYLDDDHIWPDELDEDGFASISGHDGQTYDVQINY